MKTPVKLAVVLTVLCFAQNVSAFFDPNLGRWITRDPLGEPGFETVRHINPWQEDTRNGRLPAEITQGPNLYAFVANNPVNKIDPLGLDFASCYADCIESYRNPLTEQLPNWFGRKCGAPGNIVPPWVPPALHGGNALGNALAGPTGRMGIGGVPSHPTSWQHKVGSQFGTGVGRAGRFAGRAAVVVTVAEGFFDIGLLGGCAAACVGE